METTKKTKQKTKTAGKDKILLAYRQAVLTGGTPPASVFAFCQTLGITEESFYEFYGSFEAIQKDIWKAYLQTVAGRLHSDPSYGSFASREKILAFYFTLVEVLKADRSFVLHGLHHWTNPAMPPTFIKAFKADFDAWLSPVLNEGKQNGEVAKRPFLDSRYESLFWLHLLFILHFWSKDDSPSFEKTDAAIEKSVNLAFDLIGKGVLDNAIDFMKFMYQNGMK